MTQDILSLVSQKKVQDFIRDNEFSDERILVLKQKMIQGVPASIVADQISGRRKAKFKLPEFYDTYGLIYPPSLNLEQCSSELTARFKAKLLTPGQHGLDLTGGFGVDAYYLSKICDRLDYVEPNSELASIAIHNHKTLGASSIRHSISLAEAFLDTSQDKFDFVFMDPSRRSGSKKVFRLADCLPDPTKLTTLILKNAEQLLIKTSPLLDLQQGINELIKVERVFVVAVNDECKEVLFLCTKFGVSDPVIECIDLRVGQKTDQPVKLFSFRISEERKSSSTLRNPEAYLYEPSAAILKAGAFKLIGQKFDLSKIQTNTHLYTSDKLINNFPGRIFKIEEAKPERNGFSKCLPDGKANVMVRNYPLSPEEIRKKYKLKDGGNKYVIGFSGASHKFLVVANRIN